MESFILEGLSARELEHVELVHGDQIFIVNLVQERNRVQIVEKNKAVDWDSQDQKNWAEDEEQDNSLCSQEPLRPLIHRLITTRQRAY